MITMELVSDIPPGHFSCPTFPPKPNHKPNPNTNPTKLLTLTLLTIS